MPKPKISPSSLERIFACRGSLYAELMLESQFSAIANRGTDMHAVAQAILSNNSSKMAGITLSETDMEQVNKYCNYIKSFEADKLILEQYHKFNDPDFLLHGFPDAIIVKGRNYTIVDLKTGFKEVTDPYKNPQLLAYALLVHKAYKTERIYVTIFQPYKKYEKAEILLDDIISLEDKIREVIKLNKEGIVYTPSEQACQYCKARFICGAYMEILDEPLPKKEAIDFLEPDQLAEIYGKIKQIEALGFPIREKIVSLIDKGHEVGGWKLAQGTRTTINVPYETLMGWINQVDGIPELGKYLNQIVKVDAKELGRHLDLTSDFFDEFKETNKFPKLLREKGVKND